MLYCHQWVVTPTLEVRRALSQELAPFAFDKQYQSVLSWGTMMKVDSTPSRKSRADARAQIAGQIAGFTFIIKIVGFWPAVCV